MSAPIPLRRDFDASQLRSLAKKTKDGPQARRFLRWRRSMTVRRAPRRRKSAASGFRSSGTGYCTSTSAALTVSERQVAGPAVAA